MAFPKSSQLAFALPTSSSAIAPGRPGNHRGISALLCGDGLYTQRQGRPEPAGTALPTLGSGLSRLLPAARTQQAGRILRDLNVAHTELDLANPKSNRGKKGFTDEERQGFHNLLNAGFVDTLRLFTQGNGHYTWWSPFANSRARNVGWRIDYVLVSSQLRESVKAAGIHADVLGSDHCPVSIALDLPAPDKTGAPYIAFRAGRRSLTNPPAAIGAQSR